MNAAAGDGGIICAMPDTTTSELTHADVVNAVAGLRGRPIRVTIMTATDRPRPVATMVGVVGGQQADDGPVGVSLMLKPCLTLQQAVGRLALRDPHRRPTDRRRGGGHGIRTFRAATLTKRGGGTPGAAPGRMSRQIGWSRSPTAGGDAETNAVLCRSCHLEVS